jgi:hypothetical protein
MAESLDAMPEPTVRALILVLLRIAKFAVSQLEGLVKPKR